MNRTEVLLAHDRLDAAGISASTLRSTSSTTSIGKARNRSVMRIRMSSNLPPR